MKDWIISEILRAPAVASNPVTDLSTMAEPRASTTGAFQVNSSKYYVSEVNLSVKDNIKFLENLNQWFKQTISWKKHRSAIITQLKNNNLDYMIDPIFRNIDRLFILLFNVNANVNDDFPETNFFDDYYMTAVEIKDFNALIDKNHLSNH